MVSLISSILGERGAYNTLSVMQHTSAMVRLRSLIIALSVGDEYPFCNKMTNINFLGFQPSKHQFIILLSYFMF